jgi:hypothetical protein
MRRRVIVTSTAFLAGSALVAATAAGAATHKKPAKTKVKKGGYTVTALPDPTMEATGLAGQECLNIDPASVDNHPLTLPGTGLLKVVLDSPDPTPGSKMDWDLHLLDAKGNIISSSNGPTAHEEIDQPGVRGKVTIRACNLMGEPTATVSWTFTYR